MNSINSIVKSILNEMSGYWYVRLNYYKALSWKGTMVDSLNTKDIAVFKSYDEAEQALIDSGLSDKINSYDILQTM